MIAANLARSTINARMNKIRAMLKWAASPPRRFVPASVYHESLIVANLKRGRSDAREPDEITPADPATVKEVRKYLSPMLADMVALHRLAGFRSTELCTMRPGDIDRSAKVWVYQPKDHKTKHLGHWRKIPLGPRAQKILTPYLDRSAEEYMFKPSETQAARRAAQRAARQTPVQPSQIDRSKPESEKRRRFKPCYHRNAYYHAVQVAFKKADAANQDRPESKRKTLVRFTPHQLRHAFLTDVAGRYGVEIARASGGHASLDATEIYLERDLKQAAKVAASMG